MFSLPSELKEIVSSANVLLKEFQKATVEERTFFRVFLSSSVTLSPFETVQFFQQIRDEIVETSKAYIWHYSNNMDFRIVCPSTGKLVHLEGLLFYGECVDDEWYLAKILFDLTKKYENIIVSIEDIDGQFLLIEAADDIPDWLSPENCNNRLWLKSGKLHLIVVNHKSHLSLGASMTIINHGENRFLNSKITRQITQRISSFDLLERYIQPSVIIVPRSFARILKVDNVLKHAILSDSIHEFHREKRSSSVTYFKKDCQICDMVALRIDLSKGLYAKLMSKNVHVENHRQFLFLCEKFGVSLVSESPNQQRLLKALQIGFQFTLALDHFISKFRKITKSHKKGEHSNSVNTVKRYPRAQLDRLGFSVPEMTGLIESGYLLISDDLESDMSCFDPFENDEKNDCDIKGPSLPKWYLDAHDRQSHDVYSCQKTFDQLLSILEQIESSESSSDKDRVALAKLEITKIQEFFQSFDSKESNNNDDWMNFDPTQLESLFSSSSSKYPMTDHDSTSFEANDHNDDDSSDIQNSTLQFDDILKKMGEFMSSQSGLEGVDQYETTKHVSTPSSPSISSFSESIQDPLFLKYKEFFLEENQGNHRTATEADDIDSDDEMHGIDRDVQLFQDAMDEELGQSKVLQQSFERHNNKHLVDSSNQMVDLDSNLLHSFVESHASAISSGTIGPTDLLLHQLGTKMPSVPLPSHSSLSSSSESLES